MSDAKPVDPKALRKQRDKMVADLAALDDLLGIKSTAVAVHDPTKQPPPDAVIGWLLDGVRSADIVQRIGESWPDTDAAEVVREATDFFRHQADTLDERLYVGWIVSAQRDLYRRLIEAGDFAAASRVLSQLHKTVSEYVRVRDSAGSEDDEEGDPDAGPEVRDGEE